MFPRIRRLMVVAADVGHLLTVAAVGAGPLLMVAVAVGRPFQK
jgi:hypothetical protein